MLVTLIPFFLAANVSVNTNEWNHGPEVIFDAKFDGVTPEFGALRRTVMFNTTMKVKCRLQDKLSLICSYIPEAVELTKMKSLDKTHVVERTNKLDHFPKEEELFAVNFDRNNLEPIMTQKTTGFFQHQLVKALVDQLRLGMILIAGTESGVETMMNSSIGECPTTYRISSTKIDEDETAKEENSYHEIVFVPGVRTLHNETMNLQITRNLHGCHQLRPVYPFSKIERQVAASNSHVIITKNTFVAYTDYEVLFKDVDRASSMQGNNGNSIGRERVSVTLDKIVPASGPAPKILEPHLPGFYSSRVFYSDSIEYLFPKYGLVDKWINSAGV